MIGSAHTPGPWTAIATDTLDPDSPHASHFDIDAWDANDESSETICYTFSDDAPTGQANAHLIAGAPCLLSALTALQQEINNLVEDGTLQSVHVASNTGMVQASEAIAKATQ